MVCECATCGEVEKLNESYSDEVYIVDCGACGSHQEEYFEPFEDSAAGEMGWVFAIIPVDEYPRPLRFDTWKPGLSSIYRPYIAAALCRLWEHEKLGVGGSGSGEIWLWLNAKGYKAQGRGQREGSNLSRASVIFGLNRLVDQGVLEFELKTGKGGHHRIYRPAMDPYEFKAWVLDVVQYKLSEVFNNNFWEVKP